MTVYDDVDDSALLWKHKRIAEIINDFDPELQLAWIPPQDRTVENRPPFVIVHTPACSEAYPVMFLEENEVDERLIARLFLINNNNANVLDRIEAEDAARRAYTLKLKMDEDEERLDFIITVLGSPLHTFRHGGVKYQ